MSEKIWKSIVELPPANLTVLLAVNTGAITTGRLVHYKNRSVFRMNMANLETKRIKAWAFIPKIDVDI